LSKQLKDNNLEKGDVTILLTEKSIENEVLTKQLSVLSNQKLLISTELSQLKSEFENVSRDYKCIQSKLDSVDKICLSHIMYLNDILNENESISIQDTREIRNKIQNTNPDDYNLENHLLQLREYICQIENY